MKKTTTHMYVWSVSDQDGSVIGVFTSRPTMKSLRKHYELGYNELETEIVREMINSVQKHVVEVL